MVDYVWLKTEIEKPAYAGLDDFAIAAAINAATFEDTQDIRSQDAVEEMLFTNARDWGELCLVAEGSINATVAVKKAARSVKALFELPSGMFDATTNQKWTRFNTMLDDLIAGNVITNASKTAIAALRVLVRPLWFKFGREVDFNDVLTARNNNVAALRGLSG
jgi:hypothetical protein